MKRKIIQIMVLLGFCLGNMINAKAQTANFGTGYFQNQYLFNPAMLGANANQLNVNAAFKRESTGIDNGPKTLYFSADYGFGNAMGLGVNVLVDKLGPLSTTKLMASYGYQLKIDDSQKVLFGLSAGGVVERFNTIDVVGDGADELLYNYSDRKMQFEADFGAAYVRDGLTVQATAPNLVATLGNQERSSLNLATLFAAVSYRFNLTGTDRSAINLEPKVAYRTFKGLKNLIDVGANADFMQNLFNVYGMYHTNKSFTGGVGFKALDALQIAASYTSASNSYNGGSLGNAFEVGLRFAFAKKK